MIKNYLLKTVNKHVDEYFESINPDDVEYGLLNGEIKLQNTLFKQTALKKFSNFLLKNSRVEEILIKYTWSMFGKDDINITIKNMFLNLEVGENIQLEDKKTSNKPDKHSNISINIENVIVCFGDITLSISNVVFSTSEVFQRKNLKLKNIALRSKNRQLLVIPLVESEINFKEQLSLNVLVRQIQVTLNLKDMLNLFKHKEIFEKGLKPSKEGCLKLICNIRMIKIDFTDIRKRIVLNTMSMSVSNKFRMWIEKIRGCFIPRKHNFTPLNLKNTASKNFLIISKFYGDSNFYKVEKVQAALNQIYNFFKAYESLSMAFTSTTPNNSVENIVFTSKECIMFLDGMKITTVNNRFEKIKSFNPNDTLKMFYSADCIRIDKILKVECVKIGYENKKMVSRTGNVFVNLEKVDLKSILTIYKKYSGGEESLNMNIEQYITNLRIVYGQNTTLIEMDGLNILYNALFYSFNSPLLAITSESDSYFEVFKSHGKLICCMSNALFDLKLLKRFNNDYLIPRESEIKHFIKELRRNGREGSVDSNIYFYNTNIFYEDLKLNIEFLEYNTDVNTIFSVSLEEDKYLIIDNAHLNVVIGDILLFNMNQRVRINISNLILRKLNRFFKDVKNNILLSIQDEDAQSSSLCWILATKNVSFNVFDGDLKEIVAFYLFETKICNLKENDGDETVRKLYFKINDIQVDNQEFKNKYPVIFHKSSSNDIIEGNILYYYNSSTLFIQKTNLKFEETRLNIESKLLNRLVDVFKLDLNEEPTPFESSVESFMNTCVTVKNLCISELKIKINYLMTKGDGLKERMLSFVLNNISDFNLFVEQMIISHHRTDVKGLVAIVYGFYKNEIYNNLFKVVGHIDLLGNVGALTSTISGTIKDNVKKKTGFFKGTKNLFKNTFVGVTTTLGKISTSVKNNAGLITFDKDFVDSSEFHPYAYDVNLPLPFKKNNNKSIELLMKGTERFISSVYSGVVGVAKKPYDGSEKGVGGVIVGLGKAVIGAISKPVVGASELLTNCTQLLGGTSESTKRILYPLYNKDKIGKYCLDVSASYFMFCTSLRQMKGEEFIDGSFGFFKGEALLFLTNFRLIISNESTVYEANPYEIHLDSRVKHAFKFENETVSVYRKEFITKLCELLM